MSFLGKLKFWKRDEDFSFDSSVGDSVLDSKDSFSSDGFNLPPDPSENSFAGSPSDPLAPQPSGITDSHLGFSNPSEMSNSAGSNFNHGSLPDHPSFNNPVPPPRDFNVPSNGFSQQTSSSNSLGRSLARDFIDRSENKQNMDSSSLKNPVSSEKNGDFEILNLKIDAIKSELGNMSQRIQHIEQLLVEQNKKRGW